MFLLCRIPLVLSGQWEERRREVKESAFTPPKGAAPPARDYQDRSVLLSEKKYTPCTTDAFFLSCLFPSVPGTLAQNIILRD